MPRLSSSPVVSVSSVAGLTYSQGAYFRPGDNSWPVAFNSLHDLKKWWSTRGGGVYSINSVSTSTAICVEPNAFFCAKGENADWLLYMAPSPASSAPHYVTRYLKASGSGAKPFASGLSLPYVVIRRPGSSSWPDSVLFNCIPDLTQCVRIAGPPPGQPIHGLPS